MIGVLSREAHTLCGIFLMLHHKQLSAKQCREAERLLPSKEVSISKPLLASRSEASQVQRSQDVK